MPRALRRESDDFGQAAAVPRFGDDPQPLGEEQAFGLAAPSCREATAAALRWSLEKAVTWRGINPPRTDPRRASTSLSSAASASSPSTWMTMRVAHRGAQHHQAHDRRAADAVAVLFDLDRWRPGPLARLTNLALARA